MQDIHERWEHPRLKELVVEASRALAHLDADRLEELALSCQALQCDLVAREQAHTEGSMRAELAKEAVDARREMAVFGRVLEATRSNLNVMNRLRELRAGQLEYGLDRLGRGEPKTPGWRRTESGHGDN